jgi:hypothetical protein
MSWQKIVDFFGYFRFSPYADYGGSFFESSDDEDEGVDVVDEVEPAVPVSTEAETVAATKKRTRSDDEDNATNKAEDDAKKARVAEDEEADRDETGSSPTDTSDNDDDDNDDENVDYEEVPEKKAEEEEKEEAKAELTRLLAVGTIFSNEEALYQALVKYEKDNISASLSAAMKATAAPPPPTTVDGAGATTATPAKKVMTYMDFDVAVRKMCPGYSVAVYGDEHVHKAREDFARRCEELAHSYVTSETFKKSHTGETECLVCAVGDLYARRQTATTPPCRWYVRPLALAVACEAFYSLNETVAKTFCMGDANNETIAKNMGACIEFASALRAHFMANAL